VAKKKITFVIDGFTPETLPIGRLANYLRYFAALVGPDGDVHFERVAKGSTQLISHANEPTVPEVRHRITEAERGLGDEVAIDGFIGLKKMLFQDQTTGRIKEERRKIVEFRKPEVLEYGSVVEESELEGIIIRIGGKDETVHVHILDGDKTTTCIATRTQGRELKKYLLEFDQPVRLFGKGKWYRTPDGTWELGEFRIGNHEPLNGDDLQLVLERMRQIPGSGWDKIDDPLAELERIRKGTPKVQ